MRFNAISIVAIAATAVAQVDTSGIPTCAIDCIVNTNPLSGCQGLYDFPCLCLTGDPYSKEIAACILGACNSDDVGAMVRWKTDACAQYGVVWP